MDTEQLRQELLALVTAFASGSADEDEQARFERLLADYPEARSLYLRIADDTVTLRNVGSEDCRPGLEKLISPERDQLGLVRQAFSRWKFPFGLAVAILVLLTAAWLAKSNNQDGPNLADNQPAASFARIVNLSNVVWSEGSKMYSSWDRLGSTDSLKLENGRIEVLYDHGVHFLVQGPADLRLISENQINASSGKYVARVSPYASGFEIKTPHAEVIDRGTAFGVTVDEDHQTDVVVYEGAVDLKLDGDSEYEEMSAGEALRIGRNGQMSRIASVASDLFLPPPSLVDNTSERERLILSVSDNLKEAQSAKSYRVISRGFREDCQAFVDRVHQWNGVDENGIPPFLENCDYVMTFNDDKVDSEIEISVEVSRPARLFILLDERVVPPKWLKEGFVKTDWKVGIDEGYYDSEEHITERLLEVGPGRGIDHACFVWARDIPEASTITLGSLGIAGGDEKLGALMYGIVASELPASHSVAYAKEASGRLASLNKDDMPFSVKWALD